jgi:hypothetical protein
MSNDVPDALAAQLGRELIDLSVVPEHLLA